MTTACDNAREGESPPAAAAFVEALRHHGIDAAAEDARIARWVEAGMCQPDIVAAIAEAKARRAKAQSPQPVNVGLVDVILADALAARSAPTAVAASPPGPWHRSWSGIVAHGRALAVDQIEGEPDAEFKLRVFRAAGDGPWWDEHFPPTRGNGPVPVAALVGNAGNRGGHAA
jgi:hypothetical protein